MPRNQSSAILFEMLRSFTTLARTLNLSKAVRELDSTRQTVRRHISLLEESKGESLFILEDRQYRLTQAGRQSILEAEGLLARGEAWLNNQSDHINGLSRLTYQDKSNFSYNLQQHPIDEIWRTGTPLLQTAFKCWASSKAEIEAKSFAPIRPYITVFRLLDPDWICAEIGEKSSYASWYGWQAERSSIGRAITDMPGGTGFEKLLSQPFREVLEHGGGRLDHIHTQLSRKPGGTPVPISYQRLLLGCRFPDGSFALVTMIDRTYNIKIEGLSDEQAQSMSPEHIMEIEL